MSLLHTSRTTASLAVVAAAVMVATVLPAVGTAGAQGPARACPASVPQAPFTDRAGISTAHAANVDCAAFNEIVTGFADGAYRPRAQVRRDQMASFVARTLTAAGVALPAPAPDTFDDVSAASPHAGNIRRLKAAGIIVGAPAGLGPAAYGPTLRTRRDQMASFLVRAAEYALDTELASTTEQFADVPTTNSHVANVNAAAELGLALGVSASMFAPGQATLRDQMASFVVRLLAFVVEGGPLDGPVLDLAVTPSGCVVGEVLTATATLTVEGDAVQGEMVRFATSGVPTSPEEAAEVTDATGQARFAFVPVEVGVATVTATFDASGQEAAGTAQVTCEEPEAADSGVVVEVHPTAQAYVYVPDGGDGTRAVGYGGPDHTFTVDGALVSAEAFTTALSPGDRVAVTDDGRHHALVDVDPPADGVVGNLRASGPGTSGGTYAVIDPSTGTQLSGYLDYVDTCDLYRVDGQAASVAAFEADISEGDDLARSFTGAAETCSLTNQTVSGTVHDAVTDPFPAALFRIDNLGDSFDDAAAATGPLATSDLLFLVDPGYPDQEFTVDGAPATRAAFVDALTDGAQAAYSRVGGTETFTLVTSAG